MMFLIKRNKVFLNIMKGIANYVDEYMFYL